MFRILLLGTGGMLLGGSALLLLSNFVLADKPKNPKKHLWYQPETIGTLTGHKEEATSLAFSPNGELLASGSHDNTVIIWDLKAKKAKYVLKNHDFVVDSVVFHPSGKFLVSNARGVQSKTFENFSLVTVWDISTGKAVKEFRYFDYGTELRLAPDGTYFVLGGTDKKAFQKRYGVSLFSFATGKPITALMAHRDSINDFCISPNGRLIATAGSEGAKRDRIVIWDLKNEKELLSFDSQMSEVRSLAFSPDGTILATGGIPPANVLPQPPSLILFDVKTGKDSKWPLLTHVSEVDFSPDGKMLAFSFGSMTWMNVKTGAATYIGEDDDGDSPNEIYVDRFAFSPDGKILAVINKKVIVLWKTKLP